MNDIAKYQVIRLVDRPELKNRAAQWFSEKWSIPIEAYIESIEESFKSVVPSWYVCLDGDEIVAGMGVIENDFHDRNPNPLSADRPYELLRALRVGFLLSGNGRWRGQTVQNIHSSAEIAG